MKTKGLLHLPVVDKNLVTIGLYSWNDHKPNKKIGYYGSDVAAPVFKRIAEKISSRFPEIEEYNFSGFLKKRKLISKGPF